MPEKKLDSSITFRVSKEDKCAFGRLFKEKNQMGHVLRVMLRAYIKKNNERVKRANAEECTNQTEPNQ